MQRFQPSFLDKLLDSPGPNAARRTDQGLSLEEVRERVASDLEALLNTRCGVTAEAMSGFPRSRGSVLGFGLEDFSSLSLVKPEDREAICQSLEQAVLAHEPRLRQVRVELLPARLENKRLRFHIHAQLAVQELREPINFNATLHPVTQHYQVARL